MESLSEQDGKHFNISMCKGKEYNMWATDMWNTYVKQAYKTFKKGSQEIKPWNTLCHLMEPGAY